MSRHAWRLWRTARRVRRPSSLPSATDPGASSRPLRPRPAAGTALQRLVDLHHAWNTPPGTGPEARSFTELLTRLPPGTDDAQRLDAWLAEQYPGVSPGSRLVQQMRWLDALALVIAALSGCGLMTALIAYDGSQQVNVLWIIGFALLQSLLTLVSLVAVWRRPLRLPLFSDLLGHLPRRLIPRALRDLLTAPQRPNALLAPLHGAYLIQLLQRSAVLFNLGALAALLVVISLEDIAFGWSTTLQWSPEQVHRWVSVLAWPWSWWSAAVPSLELVSVSQYFRLEGSARPDAARPLGAWWPFLACLWTVYAVLPRWLLSRWSQHRWRRLQHQALHSSPWFEHTLAQFRFDHALAARDAALLITSALHRMLKHRERRTLENPRQEGLARTELEQRWRTTLTEIEAETLQALAQRYLQPVGTAPAEQLALPAPETLFQIQDWERWGLDKRRLAWLAGLGGGGMGGALDLATGGATLGVLAATFGLGAAASVYWSDHVARWSADSSVVQFGPAQHRQFPWVILGRLVTRWMHLDRHVPGQPPPGSPMPDWRQGLDRQRERELERLFSRYRKDAPMEEGALMAPVEALLLALMPSRPTAS